MQKSTFYTFYSAILVPNIYTMLHAPHAPRVQLRGAKIEPEIWPTKRRTARGDVRFRLLWWSAALSARNWDPKRDRLHMQLLSCISAACTRTQHAAASHGWLFAGRMMSPQGCTNTGRRVRAREGSPLAARFEVLVSPARPRTIFTANESLPSQGAGFLSLNLQYSRQTSCDKTLRKRRVAQPAERLLHKHCST